MIESEVVMCGCVGRGEGGKMHNANLHMKKKTKKRLESQISLTVCLLLVSTPGGVVPNQIGNR